MGKVDRSDGRSVGRSGHGRKEGRGEGGREERLIEKDSEMLTADRQKKQGCGNFGFYKLAFKRCVVIFHHFTFDLLIHPGLA